MLSCALSLILQAAARRGRHPLQVEAARTIVVGVALILGSIVIVASLDTDHGRTAVAGTALAGR